MKRFNALANRTIDCLDFKILALLAEIGRGWQILALYGKLCLQGESGAGVIDKLQLQPLNDYTSNLWGCALSVYIIMIALLVAQRSYCRTVTAFPASSLFEVYHSILSFLLNLFLGLL